MSFDGFGLTRRQRHALTQTVAAEQLEGWRPTSSTSWVWSDCSRGCDFRRIPGPASARTTARTEAPFARRRPYLLPGTTVLRNQFGVSDGGALARLEFVATAGRILQVHSRCGAWDLDVRRLHQHVFGDVYAWAGEPRIVELRRGPSVFGSCARIPRALQSLAAEVEALATEGVSLDHGELTYRLARIYADYNHIHPFREGNGRTGTLLLHLVAARAGRRLHLDRVTRDNWISASRDSMPFRRDGQADPRPFVAVLRGCLSDATRCTTDSEP